MPTNKYRFSVLLDDELHEAVEDFRHEHRLNSQSKAVAQLLVAGLRLHGFNVHDPYADVKAPEMDDNEESK